MARSFVNVLLAQGRETDSASQTQDFDICRKPFLAEQRDFGWLDST
jgi:hypothetical protein